MKFVLRLLPLLFKRKKSWATILAVLAGLGFFNREKLSMEYVQALFQEPREVLVDRVEDARDVQKEVAEELKTAMERFKDLTGFEGGELEQRYTELDRAYQRSRKESERIYKRVKAVERAANNLLKEWNRELDDYDSRELRARAEEQLHATRERCNELIRSMLASYNKAQPILDLLHDQVLYLKHNLNAKAIASLDEEAVKIEQDVDQLVRDMEASIAEADAFIVSLLGEEAES